MPFGLVNVSALFQRMVNTALGPLRHTIAMVYMDDLLLPSTSVEEGLRNLREILEVLRKAELTLRLKKRYFFQDHIDYPGYHISGEGILPSS